MSVNEKSRVDIADRTGNRIWNEEYQRMQISKEEILTRLREKGCRITRQRQIIIDVILKEECTCCKEIYYLAAKMMPEIGIATIYRMLISLESIGAIKRENPYRICHGTDAVTEQYRIELDNHEVVELSKPAFQEVLEKGMEAAGHLNGKKVTNVDIKKNFL